MKIRRIVTGHDASGKAMVWKDAVQSGAPTPVDKISGKLIWATDETPYDYARDEDMAERKLGIAPPAGGTRFSVIEIQPGNAAYMHRTDTIDYIVCVAGEIDMQLTEETVKMRAGDVMVQRGTDHAWINRGSVAARIAVVLVDGKPKRRGST
jgi:quercetin dioxygenase-like cupin family protein